MIENYKKIQNIQEEIEKASSKPTKDQMVAALDLLKVIFKTKKLDLREQIEWFNQIIEETGNYYELSDYEIPEYVNS